MIDCMMESVSPPFVLSKRIDAVTIEEIERCVIAGSSGDHEQCHPVSVSNMRVQSMALDEIDDHVMRTIFCRTMENGFATLVGRFGIESVLDQKTHHIDMARLGDGEGDRFTHVNGIGVGSLIQKLADAAMTPLDAGADEWAIDGFHER